MSDVIGGKAKAINIPVPIGKKVIGKVMQIGLSEKFDGYVDIKIEFQQFKKVLEDGSRTFYKQAFYGIPVDWSEKNKAGRLYYALKGCFPLEENVNWTKLLLGKEVACIFESLFDEISGEEKGQKIKWIGSKDTPITERKDPITMDEPLPKPSELEPDEDVPF